MPITIAGSGTITGISAGGLPDDCITTADIAAGAVAEAKVATDAVTTTKIADGSITNAKINASAAIADSKLSGTTCKAWVNFNGTGTVAIRASYNVSSITDRGVGYFTTNFSVAMSDANYAAAGWVSDRSYGATISCSSTDFAASNHQFFTCQEINGPLFDPAIVCVSYFR
jgi:hypothetical protein